MLKDKYDHDVDLNLCNECSDDCQEDYIYCELCEQMLCFSCTDEHDCVFTEQDFYE